MPMIPQAGMPPELLAQLAGGAPEGMPPEMMGGGLPPEMMGGPPPEAQPPPPQDIGSLLRGILDAASAYQEQEDDDQNLLAIEQVRTLVQKILANEQKMSDDLMQGKSSPQALRRYAA